MPLYQHICEVCGREEVLSSEEGFDAGWDYPPRMGAFGVVSPRTCPNCPITGTLWWAMVQGTIKGEDGLSPTQVATLERILSEPGSILVQEG